MADSDNVVALPGFRVPAGDGPVQAVVGALQQALREAEAGELRAVSIGKVIADGSPVRIFGTTYERDTGTFSDLIMATGCLLRRMEREYDQ